MIVAIVFVASLPAFSVGRSLADQTQSAPAQSQIGIDASIAAPTAETVRTDVSPAIVPASSLLLNVLAIDPLRPTDGGSLDRQRRQTNSDYYNNYYNDYYNNYYNNLNAQNNANNNNNYNGRPNANSNGNSNSNYRPSSADRFDGNGDSNGFSSNGQPQQQTINGQKYVYTPLFQYKQTQGHHQKLFVPNLFG